MSAVDQKTSKHTEEIKNLCWRLYYLLQAETTDDARDRSIRVVEKQLYAYLDQVLSEEDKSQVAIEPSRPAGTAGVPYTQDTEYWVRFIEERWKPQAIAPTIINDIRSAPTMEIARKIALWFDTFMDDRPRA